jgi:hypothetical protein
MFAKNGGFVFTSGITEKSVIAIFCSSHNTIQYVENGALLYARTDV